MSSARAFRKAVRARSSAFLAIHLTAVRSLPEGVNLPPAMSALRVVCAFVLFWNKVDVGQA